MKLSGRRKFPLTRLGSARKMGRRWTAALALFSTLVAHCSASALTAPIPANARQCYFAEVDKSGEKLGVRITRSRTRAPITHDLRRSSTSPCSLVDHLILTLKSRTLTAVSCSPDSANVKATSCSQRTALANTKSASRTI